MVIPRTYVEILDSTALYHDDCKRHQGYEQGLTLYICLYIHHVSCITIQRQRLDEAEQSTGRLLIKRLWIDGRLQGFQCSEQRFCLASQYQLPVTPILSRSVDTLISRTCIGKCCVRGRASVVGFIPTPF